MTDQPPGGEHTSVEPRDQRRRYPEWPLALVLVLVAVGLLTSVLDGWRLGAVVIGVGVTVGAGLRLLLPARALGLLAVRSRPLDVAVLLVAGVGIMALALLVPPAR